MAFILADRVRETTAVIGTGNATLLGSATGYQSFSAGIGASNTTYYVIADQTGLNWEVGYGTLDATGLILTRTTVLSSSNAGALVSFTTGTKDVFCDYTAKKAVIQDSSSNVTGYAISGGTVNGTTIGATTASTGAFTYISTSSSTSVTPTLSFNGSNTPYAAGVTIAGSYLQHLLQNKSGTAGASTNYVLSNDIGTDSSYYGEFGMNSSIYSAGTPADFFSINNGIYFSGHDGDITIGSGNGFKTYLAWGTAGQSAHVINATGSIGLNTNATGTTNYGTSGQVLTSAGNAATPTWNTPTIAGFTSGESTTSPNGTVYVDYLQASGASTNADAAFVPKGTGALLAQIPDGTATGGNKRGANAVDWQTGRGIAAQVASGANSFIGGGAYNTANGQNAVVAGGAYNIASGYTSFIGGGYANQGTSGQLSGIVSGYANNATGYYNLMLGGYANSGTSGSTVTTQATTIAVSAGTTLYLSATNANIKVGQLVTGTGLNNFPHTYATSTVTTGTAAVMATSSIAVTTGILTVGTLSSGTIVAGQVLTGTGVPAGTYIVSNISGSGTGSTWNTNITTAVSSTTITGTAYTITISQAATTAAGVTLSFYTPHGVVVGGGNNQATGAYSFIGGGGDAGTPSSRNSVAGDWSAVLGGTANSIGAGASYATIDGGSYNSIGANGSNSTVVGGLNCSIGAGSTTGIVGGNACSVPASIYNAMALGGRQNTATGSWSTVLGGNRGTSRGITGNTVFAASYAPIADLAGLSQSAILVLGAITTTATPVVLVSDTGVGFPSTTNQVIMPNNSAYMFTANVISTAQFALASTATAGAAGTATITFAAQTVAPFIVGQTIVVAGITPTGYNGTYTVTACTTTTVQYANATTGAQTGAGTVTATSLTKAWKLEGCIMRTSAVGGTRLVGSVTSTVLATDTGTSAWTAVAAADTTNGGLKITFTGAAATTIRTVAQVFTTECTY